MLSLPLFECPFTSIEDNEGIGKDDVGEGDDDNVKGCEEEELGADMDDLVVAIIGDDDDDVVDEGCEGAIPKSLLNMFIKLPPTLVKRLCAIFFSWMYALSLSMRCNSMDDALRSDILLSWLSIRKAESECELSSSTRKASSSRLSIQIESLRVSKYQPMYCETKGMCIHTMSRKD